VKSYALSAAGRRQLDRETAEWRRVVDAMSLVLDAKG
jgi:hypothetical protein